MPACYFSFRSPRDILFPPLPYHSLLRANDAGGWRGGGRRVEEDQHECYCDCDIGVFPQVAIYVTRERRRRRRQHLVVAFALTSEREEETNRHGAGGSSTEVAGERERRDRAARGRAHPKTSRRRTGVALYRSTEFQISTDRVQREQEREGTNARNTPDEEKWKKRATLRKLIGSLRLAFTFHDAMPRPRHPTTMT